MQKNQFKKEIQRTLGLPQKLKKNIQLDTKELYSRKPKRKDILKSRRV